MDNAGEYGVALSEQDILWKTSNGGNKWSIDTSCNFYNLNNNSWLIDIAFLSHSSFYALSSNRFIYKYFDINTDVGSNQLKEDNSNIEIYPNPCISGNKLSIKLFSDIPDIYSLSIFNSLGQKIETDYNTQFVSNFTLEFETTGLSIGIYFLSVKSKGRSIMKPFIIE